MLMLTPQLMLAEQELQRKAQRHLADQWPPVILQLLNKPLRRSMPQTADRFCSEVLVCVASCRLLTTDVI